MSPSDHDILIRVDENVDNLVKGLDKHIVDDDSFQKDSKKEIDWIKKVIYLGMGGLFVLNLVLKLVK